jgi:hypothetical protein
MKDNEKLFEVWKNYIPHVKDPKNVIFYLYHKQMFNGLIEFYYYSCKQCALMRDFILASLFLRKANKKIKELKPSSEKTELMESQVEAVKFLKKEICLYRGKKFEGVPRLYKEFELDRGIDQELYGELSSLSLDSEAAKVAAKMFNFKSGNDLDFSQTSSELHSS